MPQPWNRATDDPRVRELHATGATLHAIAKEMDRHKSGVSRAAARLGLTFDRTRTADATQAKQVDAKARRAKAVEVELELLELSQAQIRAGLNGSGWKTLVRGAMGVETTENLDYVPARDLREHTAARNGMAGIIARLDDGNTTETDQQKSLVSDLMAGLRAAYTAGQAQPENAADQVE